MFRSFSVFLFGVYFFSVAPVYSQQSDSLFIKIEEKLRLNNTGDLFLHLDKSVYVTGEKLWFTAYALGANNYPDSVHTLYAVLVNDMSQTVVTSERYVLENGIAAGSVSIPDSLQTGAYSLLAYTNSFLLHSSGSRFFRQSVGLVGVKPSCNVEVAGVNRLRKDSVEITIRTTRTEGGIPRNAEVGYSLYGDGKEITKGKNKINTYGEIKVRLPFLYAAQILEMRGIVKEDKTTTWFKIPLLWDSEDYIIRLLPDGGRLVNNYPSILYYQLLTTSGRGIAARLALMENDVLIDSFVSDVYGTGVISFTPHAGKRYAIVVKDEPEKKIYQQFPEIQHTGYAVSIEEGNIVTGDSIVILLNTPENESSYILTAHNNNEIFSQLAIRLHKGKGKLKLPVNDWPAGVDLISLFDDKAILRAQTKMLLLPDTSQVVSMKTDSFYYHPRSKVTMQIKVADKEGKPLQGIFSLSSASDKAFRESFTDISRFNLLDRFLGNDYVYPPLSFLQERNHLGYFLNQKKGQSGNPAANLFPGYTAPRFTGQVLYNNKKIRKPVNLIVMGPKIGSVTTDENGYFKLPEEVLQVNRGETVFLSVSSENPDNYKIVFDESEDTLNDLLAKQYYPLPVFTRRDMYSVEQKEAIQSSSVKTLQTVVVKSDNRDADFASYTSTTCNDYVCPYGYLNCYNHPGEGTRAVEGGKYRVHTGSMVVYHCGNNYDRDRGFIKPVKPVYTGDTFSAPDLTITNDSIATELLTRTTLFWSPLIITDEKGEATVSFYTNDVKGRFTCILQGITNEGVIHGRVSFVVKE